MAVKIRNEKNRIRKELRERIFALIESQSMRNHFMEMQDEITTFDYIEIIVMAPVSITKKVELLEELGKEKLDDKNAETIAGCVRAAKDALKRLDVIDPAKSCLQLLCMDTDHEITFYPYISDAVPVIDYKHALQYIKEEYGVKKGVRYEFYFKHDLC